MLQVSVNRDAGPPAIVNLDRLPDSCPLCHKAIVAVDTTLGAQMDQVVERVLRCPNSRCRRFFIARYRPINPLNSVEYRLHETGPLEQLDLSFSPTIASVSKDYCKIFSQANRAELAQLDLIAGPGYRKALEFLVKDYLIGITPEATEKEKIRALLLGSCISKYVKNEKIKQMAARAAWLGNDETHFYRRWEHKDLQDLKRLIELTVHWIEMEKLTEDVMNDMPVGKPQQKAAEK